MQNQTLPLPTSLKEARDENCVGCALIAVLLTVFAANTADASYCGAARYHRCKRTAAGLCKLQQQCYTVMKTCSRWFTRNNIHLHKTATSALAFEDDQPA